MIKEELIPPIYSSSNIAIRLHMDSMHTFYGNPYSSQTAYNLQEEQRQANYTEELIYINSTYRNITIMGRNGLAVNIPYISSFNNTGFIIRKIIKIKGPSLNSAIIGLHALDHIDSAELIEIKKAISNIDIKSYSFTSIMIDYQIKLDDLKAKGNTLYHYQTDLVLSTEDTINTTAHPYSTRFLGIGTFGIKNDYIHQQELNLKVKYVNHDHNASPVYLNILGKVFTVYPQKDAPSRKIYTSKAGEQTFEDYLLFYYSSRNDPDIISGSGVNTIKMTLAEAKIKIGLYDNYTDALNFGNIELTRKEELLTLNHKLELLKQSTTLEKTKLEKQDLLRKEQLLEKEHILELLKKETAQLKQDLELATQKLNIEILNHKQKQIVIDSKMQELDNEKRLLDLRRRDQDEKMEREKKEFDYKLNTMRDAHDYRLKQESMYWKDFYEKRSHERKDTSEVFKFIPGLVLGVVGIASVFIKMSPSKA